MSIFCSQAFDAAVSAAEILLFQPIELGETLRPERPHYKASL
jgi:hypothetical protein